MDAINHLECKLSRLALSLHPSVPLKPLGEVLQQYTDTLCTAQKKTSFVNTLLQDITIATTLYNYKIGSLISKLLQT